MLILSRSLRDFYAELKKNCSPELIIYIVGSKADLHRHRQVTEDFARLSLHNWFPPPRPPPPPPPPPQPSTLSYIRPRFTSFPGIRSAPATPVTQTAPETPAYLDLTSARSSSLHRTRTTSSRTSGAPSSVARSTTNASATRSQPSRFGSHFGFAAGGWNEVTDSSNSNSIEEDDEGAAEEEEEEWGLSKGMELFEVSAKDNLGKLSSGSSNSRRVLTAHCRCQQAFKASSTI